MIRNLSKKNSRGNIETLRLKVKFRITVEESTVEGRDELRELVSKATRDVEAMAAVPWESVLTKLRKFHNIAIGISGVCDMKALGVNLSLFTCCSSDASICKIGTQCLCCCISGMF